MNTNELTSTSLPATDQGLITDKEYETKRRLILDGM
jgi:hypothetical protein